MYSTTETAVSKEFAEQLGRFVFIFNTLEYRIITFMSYYGEEGIFNKYNNGKMTAGNVSYEFNKFLKKIGKNILHDYQIDPLNDLAEYFSKLVKKRNAVVHGKPAESRKEGNHLYRGDTNEAITMEYLKLESENVIKCRNYLDFIVYHSSPYCFEHNEHLTLLPQDFYE